MQQYDDPPFSQKETQKETSDVNARVEQWLQGDFDSKTKETILFLRSNNQEELKHAFASNLSFGTGGVRGIMGVGPNRFNQYTLGWMVEGACQFFLQRSSSPKLRCVCAYDSRNGSGEFAHQACRIALDKGIETWLFPSPAPTPLLSFACRYLGCDFGMMITASHNPKEYNGFKLYQRDGSQVGHPDDQGVLEIVLKKVNKVKPVKTFPEKQTRLACNEVPKEVEEAYLHELQSLYFLPLSSIRIVYSSLHGTGGPIANDLMQGKSMKNTCAHFTMLHQQCVPDGNFPTVRVPNPEDKESLSLGMQELAHHDLFIATDPDADRMGAVVRHKGENIILNGNETAILLLDFLIQKGHPKQGKKVLKSLVTTEMLRAMAEEAGLSLENVATGFKHIAEKIRKWEQELPQNNEESPFFFGAEESLGYLAGTYVRDKDGIASLLLLSQAAEIMKQKGLTLVDRLHTLYEGYGVFQQETEAISLPEGKDLNALHNKVCQYFLLFSSSNSFKARQEYRVAAFENYNEGHGVLMEDSVKYNLSIPKEKMILLHLKGETSRSDLPKGGRIILRGSGTEPKYKIYVELFSPPGAGSIQSLMRSCKEETSSICQLVKSCICSIT